MRLIDADALGNRMYHESFEKDSDLQKWDGGCWIRYKLFEQVLREAPTIDPIYPTPSNTLGALDYVDRKNGKVFPVEPISYLDCSNAMLKMWMDNVVTDGEYNRIMDKLNKKHEEDMRGENE